MAGDDRVEEERVLDLDGLVEFVAAVGGQRLRPHTLFVNSALTSPGRSWSGSSPLGRPTGRAWPAATARACVDGQARLDQWLVIAAPLGDRDWPCDERSNGACYRNTR